MTENVGVLGVIITIRRRIKNELGMAFNGTSNWVYSESYGDT